MARILTTVRDVVDALGGVPAVARELDVIENTVWNWISAGVIPANKYCAMTEMLVERSAAAPDALWRMAKRAGQQRRPELAA